MQSVYKLVSTVNQFYREINPATLSGAIDVIVVQQPDGDLACSPFHVRFGKLSVLRPQEKKVEVTVNGKLVDFPMKVGEAGEAFFIIEMENEVPHELQTSPLAGPTQPLSSEEEPDFLDIGESRARSPKEPIADRVESFVASVQSGSSSDISTEDGCDGNVKPKILVAEPESLTYHGSNGEDISNHTKGSDETPVAEESISNITKWSEDTLVAEESTKDNTLSEIENVMTLEEIQVQSNFNSHNDIQNKHSKEAANAYEEQNENNENIGQNEFEETPNSPSFLEVKMRSEAELESQLDYITSKNQNNVINQNGVSYELKISIDKANTIMDGHKSSATHKLSIDERVGMIPTTDKNQSKDQQDAEQAPADYILDKLNKPVTVSRPIIERQSSLPIEYSTWEKPEGPFSDTELDETRKPENPIERRVTRVSPLSDTELEYEPKKPSTSSEEWSWRWGDLPVRTSDKMLQWQEASENKEWEENEYEKGVEIDGKFHRISMSLCGNEKFGHDEIVDDELFRKNEITYEHFCVNPHLLNEKALVFKYEGRYYTWATAAPIMVSLLVFQKPLPKTTIASLSSTTTTKTLQPSDRRRYSFGRGWSRWFRGSASHNTLDQTTKSIEESEDNDTKQLQIQMHQTKHYAKTLRLTSEQLKSLNLKKGGNTISFSVASSYQGKATCVAKLFFWDYDAQIVISDIDGTITKSDALGHVFTMIGKDWTHSGVAKLYTDIRNNGYQILYLTSRAIGQADYTRDYLRKVEQDKYQLPDGPVIMSPDRLLTAFHREVIIRKPEVFKMACLRDVKKLFGDRNPFFAGFGNRITACLINVDVPSSRIFTIDSNGTVKLELLSGYKSSYIDLSDLVDQMFPHIGSKKWDTEYNDWNYWKPSLPKVEIPPEIYLSNTPTSVPSSPKSVPGSSPRLGMIRSLTGSITRSNSKSRPGIPDYSAPASSEYGDSSNSNENGRHNDRLTTSATINGIGKRKGRESQFNPYLNGDVDMPGRMDIIIDVDEGKKEENDDNESDDVPADIDLRDIPY
ncbi:7634_t:CDS:10 [Ambispora leptoticha]|uniref:phosphatidate phosphatase n=1 Tax=Ambispora leptoticha TaxID=144679 RepID=A0A9N8ZAX2_9GLOM|nr:7634_t:CDS:10 [Ambispora leptoticha]